MMSIRAHPDLRRHFLIKEVRPIRYVGLYESLRAAMGLKKDNENVTNRNLQIKFSMEDMKPDKKPHAAPELSVGRP